MKTWDEKRIIFRESLEKIAAEKKELKAVMGDEEKLKEYKIKKGIKFARPI